MPQVTLRARTNEALVALSAAHPEAVFEVRGAWPTDGRLRVLVETTEIGASALEATVADIPSLADLDIRHAADRSLLFEVSTPTPPPHGAMADSGIVPSFPLRLEDGWFVGELTASQERLAAFRDELDAAGIEYRIERLSPTGADGALLTERQREVLALAVERGYYESPRRTTVTELASALDVDKSAVSRTLHRAESRIVTDYWRSR